MSLSLNGAAEKRENATVRARLGVGRRGRDSGCAHIGDGPSVHHGERLSPFPAGIARASP
jgi:hypothetical protein